MGVETVSDAGEPSSEYSCPAAAGPPASKDAGGFFYRISKGIPDPDQLDLFRPRFIQQSFEFMCEFTCEWCGAPITEEDRDAGGACVDCYFGAFTRGAPPMPEGARRTACLECGYTYGTHARWCPEAN